MVILFTDKEGSEWIPFNTPLSVDDIHGNLWGPDDNGAIIEDDALYSPNGDLLPTFHSILLPDASRWDAVNTKWTFYLGSPEFHKWWDLYLINYKPGMAQASDPVSHYWWRDQGPGWTREAFEKGTWEKLLKKEANL